MNDPTFIDVHERTNKSIFNSLTKSELRTIFHFNIVDRNIGIALKDIVESCVNIEERLRQEVEKYFKKLNE